MQDKYINILKHDECISEKVMLKYLDGTLASAEQHRAERHLLDCEICSDALEGLATQHRDQLKKALRELDERIDQRLDQGKVMASSRQLFYRIAAAVIIVALFGGGLYYLQSIKKSEKVFTENFEPYRDTLHVLPPVTTQEPAVNEPRIRNELSPASPAKAEQRIAYKDKQQSSGNTNVTAPSTGATNTNTVLLDKETKTMTTDVESGREKKETVVDDKKDIATSKSNAENTNAPSVADEKHNVKQQSISRETSFNSKKENASVKKPEQNEIPSVATKAVESEDELKARSDSAALNRSYAMLKEGIKQYDEKNYSGAITIFNNVLKKEPGNTEALFYGGVSNLNMNEETVAANLLESVLKNSPNSFSDAARWYLSLAYIKKNKASKAKPLLQELSRSNNEYKSRAIKTLDELK